MLKKPPASAGSSPGSGRSLEQEVATHCSIPAWEIPRTEEPGGLQSMGLQRAGHDLGTKRQPQTGITATFGSETWDPMGGEDSERLEPPRMVQRLGIRWAGRTQSG